MSTGSRPSSPALAFRQSIAGCLATAIGEGGLSEAELAPWLGKLAPAMTELQASYHDRSLPLLRIAEATADVEAVETAYAKLVRGARAIVFFGIGGSRLGRQALAPLGGWRIPLPPPPAPNS